jgi:hypothetical protein
LLKISANEIRQFEVIFFRERPSSDARTVGLLVAREACHGKGLSWIAIAKPVIALGDVAVKKFSKAV